jgi:ABC-type iron transport system FetAB permease component
MRVGENLRPFWQNVVVVLLIIGYGLNFVLAISSLWGWHTINWLACIVLITIAIEDRKAIKVALTSAQSRFADRFFAWYILALAFSAAAINVIWFVSKRA